MVKMWKKNKKYCVYMKYTEKHWVNNVETYNLSQINIPIWQRNKTYFENRFINLLLDAKVKHSIFLETSTEKQSKRRTRKLCFSKSTIAEKTRPLYERCIFPLERDFHFFFIIFVSTYVFILFIFSDSLIYRSINLLVARLQNGNTKPPSAFFLELFSPEILILYGKVSNQ